MSQYPSPYPGPTAYYPAPYTNELSLRYLAPARRASVLMFVIGGLGICCGVCCGLVGQIAPVAQIIQHSGIDLSQLDQAGISPTTFVRIIYGVMAGGTLVVSILFITLATFVRRGSTAAIITSIVLSAIALLFMLAN